MNSSGQTASSIQQKRIVLWLVLVMPIFAGQEEVNNSLG
jgi:hypothetical protein